MTVGESSDASHDEDEKWTSEKLFHSVMHHASTSLRVDIYHSPFLGV